VKNWKCWCFHVLVLCVLLFPFPSIADDFSYDPLVLIGKGKVKTINLKISDSQRDLKIPIRIYLPEKKDASPVVLFSHGLGGSKDGNAYLGKHWAGRGYVAVFLQHIGSDTSIFKNPPLNTRQTILREAMSPQNILSRIKDVSVVLDQLDLLNKEDGHKLEGRLDMEHIGMSGHSYGTATTQMVSGQRGARGVAALTDPRIDAAVIISPNCPRGGSPETAFGKVDLPWLLMTGTKDTNVNSRLAVFPALPPGGKYELVLYDAEHSAFADLKLAGNTYRNPNHHRAIPGRLSAWRRCSQKVAGW
jgi:predicted dienelactone hydrolase